MQPRTQLVSGLGALSASSWGFSINHNPSLSPQSCFQSLLHPTCLCVWECPNPGGGDCSVDLHFTLFTQSHLSILSRPLWIHPFPPTWDCTTQLSGVSKPAQGALDPTAHLQHLSTKMMNTLSLTPDPTQHWPPCGP